MQGPFYYRRGQNQVGPLSLDAIREHAARGQFGPSDLVWAEGLPDWQPAQKFPNLFPAKPASTEPPIEPPPLPALVGGGQSSRLGQQILAELKATFQACLDQAQRLYAFAFGVYDSRRLEQQAIAAQEALGQRLEAAGLGDAALRKQLAELVERQKSVEAAKASTKLLLAERRGLYLRLAEPFLAGPPPPGMEAEHKQAVTVRDELAQAGEQQSQKRNSLLPVEPRDRLRVAAGYGCLTLVLLASAWWMLGGRWRSSDPLRNLPRGGITIAPPKNISPGIMSIKDPKPPKKVVTKPIEKTPPEKPKDKAPAQPVLKEQWLEENDAFPRRKAVYREVNGFPEGEVKYVDEKGRVTFTENQSGGMCQGKRMLFYPSGKKLAEYIFVDDLVHGTVTQWFESGTVAGKIDFVKGQVTGKSITFFRNGETCVECDYVKGVKHGRSAHFLPNGRLFAEVTHNNGQMTGQQVVLEVRQQDLRVIEERATFTANLKDHWPR